MSGSIATQLQDCLRQLHLPTFRENCHAQAVLADREGVPLPSTCCSCVRWN
jgi:hypothetical protein